MSKLSEVLRIVRERDDALRRIERLEREVEDGQKTRKRIIEFGETLDPEFRSNCVRWLDELDMSMKTWDFARIIGRGRRHGIEPKESFDFNPPTEEEK